MKSTHHLICLLFVCIFNIQAVAQLDTTSQINIVIKTYTDGERILVRWLPQDYETWRLGNEYGYRIERVITKLNDSTVSLTALADSRTILLPNVKPYREELFDKLRNVDSVFGHVAKMAIYEENPPLTNPNNPTFADALTTQDNNEIRHLFALFAADQHFDVARYMALGYEDPCIEGDEYTYSYIISIDLINQSSQALKAYSKNVSLKDTTYFPVPDIYANSGVDAGFVTWYPSLYEEVYSSYDIEKSVDGVNFVTLNELPYVILENEDVDDPIANYSDSLEHNEIAFYRVRGRTAFGISGPPSDIDTLVGLPPRLSMFVSIDSSAFILSDTQATLIWESFDNAFTDSIVGFRVHVSESSNSNFELVDPQFVSPQSRSLDLPGTSLRQYVKLQARDINGYDYYSMAHLVQPNDIDPPKMPTGLRGKYITENRIELHWNQNTDRDLKGYRVFVSNGRERKFVQITKKVIDIPIYYYDVEDDMEIDSVYFRILAADQRENYSERTPIISMPRPDRTPPDAANLYRVEPGLDGIELAWRFSEARDRVNHVLQRRMKGTADWISLLDIPKVEEYNYLLDITPNADALTNFIDTATLNIREYEYRMLAYDDSENMSSSQRKIVVPYDDGLRGTVQNIDARFQFYRGVMFDSIAYDATAGVVDSFLINDTLTMSDLNILVGHNVIDPNQRDSIYMLTSVQQFEFIVQRMSELWRDHMKVRILLIWDYEVLHALEKFEIHRSVNSPDIKYYFTASAQPYPYHMFIDEDVKSDYECTYSLYATHGDGGFSKMSTEVSVIIPEF